ncbi:MAG TPA: FAD binding domain-containing protein [Candidatus Cybelea sp.]|jgi:CO/xanthine dehydrogenase FAD-binding subunit|nr:FAD binding domain-containing protein [Candidatus Cybelea sp.]
MNLNTITEIKRPRSAEEIRHWRDGYAWLAGGTWLFSEPQIHTDTLIDLESLGWQSIAAGDDGIELAATCKIAELYAFQPSSDWKAGSLIGECCRAFLSSFKIWNEATIGGNIVMSLPAGPMISLTVALEGTYSLLPREGSAREVRAADFVTGNHANILEPGELLRSIRLPANALAKSFAFRRSELTHLGRSSVLLIGTRSRPDGGLTLTITAATVKPIQLAFDGLPTAEQLHNAIDAAIPSSLYLDDVHGSPAHRRHLTYHYAEQIRRELDS